LNIARAQAVTAKAGGGDVFHVTACRARFLQRGGKRGIRGLIDVDPAALASAPNHARRLPRLLHGDDCLGEPGAAINSRY